MLRVIASVAIVVSILFATARATTYRTERMLRVIASVAIVVSILFATARATTYRTESVASVAGAQVVRGTVRAITPERHRGWITSRLTIELETGGTTTVVVPGGTLDGVTMRVTGAPRFEIGERTQLAVRATRTGLHLVGLGTGKVSLP